MKSFPRSVRIIFVTATALIGFLFSQNSSIIIVTGNVHGQLDPCGWPKKPLGGLSKKYTTIKQLNQQGLDPLILDAGDLLFKYSVLPDSSRNSDLFNASKILKGYEKIGCDVINVGKLELSGGLSFLLKQKSSSQIPFISANLETEKSHKLIFDPFIIITKEDLQFGIIGLTNLTEVSEDGVIARDYIKEGNKYISKLKNKVDFIILLINSERSSYKKLPQYFPGADIIFTSGSKMLTRPSMKQEENGPFLFSSGREGRYLNKVTLNFLNKNNNKSFINKTYLQSRIKYQKRRLDRYMDKFPNQTYEEAYKGQGDILSIFKESKIEVERMQKELTKKQNNLEFENLPMGSSIIDDLKMLDFVDKALIERKALIKKK